MRPTMIVVATLAVLSYGKSAESYSEYVQRGFALMPSTTLAAALDELGMPSITAAEVEPLVRANVAFLDSGIAAEDTDTTKDDDGSRRDRPSADAMKAVPLLIQAAREWSHFGQAQRAQSFALVVEAMLEALAPVRSPRVLVPGSGLGRLVHDVAEALAASQPTIVAVESDVNAQLLASRMLDPPQRSDRSAEEEKEEEKEDASCSSADLIYPALHMATGWANASDRVAPVAVPDVSRARRMRVQELVSVELVVGRFPEALLQEGQEKEQEQEKEDSSSGGGSVSFDGAATCFFLDVASEVVEVIAALHSMLRPRNGTWANVGPLAYPDSAPQEALGGSNLAHPLSASQLLALVRRGGFDVIEERLVECEYGGLPRSLERGTVRRCLFFVARPSRS